MGFLTDIFKRLFTDVNPLKGKTIQAVYFRSGGKWVEFRPVK